MTRDITQQISSIWDEDAAVYDRNHSAPRPEVLAAWRTTLRRLLPDPPARVLDAGAGTGFVSLILAALGYQVTAVDLSAQMLAVLRSKADRLGLDIRTVHADVVHPPSGEIFDAVVERDIIWDSARTGCCPGGMARRSSGRSLGAHRSNLGQDEGGGRPSK